MHKTEVVVPLQAIHDCHAGGVGAKALGLAKMSRLALPVPPGFCVTASAYRRHLSDNDIMPKIQAALNHLERTAPGNKPAILSGIREAIVDAGTSDALRKEIVQHYETLRADRLAVRSSATAEDLPGHSFAGLYDTYLGVANVDCWASLWTERAYEYRQKNGFDHLLVNMAVIVQSLVDADASGVLFTADPRIGPSGNIVIESCFGLGQALVSGRLTPDRFVVHRKTLRLLFSAVSGKKIECVLDRDGTVKEQIVPNERSVAWSLDSKQTKRLAKLAGKVEAEFSCPQDIEWAVCNKRIYLLQSRPITGMPQERSWEDRQIWASNPAKEVMPDVVTPSMFSMLLEAIGEEVLDPIFRTLCCDRGDHPLYSLIAGRIYFNANLWGAVFRYLPGGRSVDLMEMAGGHKDIQEMVERLRTVPDQDLPDIKFSLPRFILKIPLIIIGTLLNTPKNGRRIIDRVSAKNEKWSDLNVSNLSPEQITTSCQQLRMDLRRLLGHILYLFSILSAFPVLHIVCTKWLGEDGSCANRLLAGVGEMDDAVAGLDLWRLAVAADAAPQVRDLILSDADWSEIEPKLSQLDSGKEFLKTWNDFMQRHGHHCRAELELYNPRWSETPDYILKLIRTYIAQIGKTDPVQNFNNITQERRQLEQLCRKKLRNPLKRIVFNFLLHRSQQGSVFRENVKSEVIKLVVALRKMLLELGRKLADKGVLKNQDDIFFLRLAELEPVVQDKADFDIRQVIADRRAEYDGNSLISPPDVIFGKFDPEKYAPESVDTGVEKLTGLAVSPGVATGKARVILRADTDEQVLAGEILIAPFTDPGWTPYFVPAAAVVMDQGGLLSHGSIIAREYGIPAVVNVGPATRIIKTGQIIQVDGNHGVVRVLC
ncbi:MAG: PEP/pyruvate-binding domain-containing protein, partial [Planctomycetota bacterium]|jgi:pyruvate,water dikinase